MLVVNVASAYPGSFPHQPIPIPTLSRPESPLRLPPVLPGPVCCVDSRWLAHQIKWMALSSSVKNMAHFAQSERVNRI